MLDGDSVDMDCHPDPVRVVIKPLLDFFGHPERAATELYSGTLKLLLLLYFLLQEVSILADAQTHK